MKSSMILILCTAISFTRCKLNKIEMKDFEGQYVSNILFQDTLCIIKNNNNLYYLRKKFNETGVVEIIEKRILNLTPWKNHGELEEETFFFDNDFSAEYSIINDTIYIFQIDANADIIEEHYYKKVSNNISNEIRNEIERNKDEIEERVKNLFIKE